MRAAPHDRAIRQALETCARAFHAPRSPAEEARAQIRLAIASLKHASELRRYNLRCFPGIYRKDRAVCLRSSVAMLALAAKRRRYAAELLARASTNPEQKAA